MTDQVDEFSDRLKKGLKKRPHAQIGDVYALSFPGESDNDSWHVAGWLLLATVEGDKDVFLAVPVADPSEFLCGSPDVNLPESETAWAMNAHCGASLIIPREIIERGSKMCFFEARDYTGGRNLAMVQQKMSEILSHQIIGTEQQKDIDDDMDYEEHMAYVMRVHTAIMSLILQG